MKKKIDLSSWERASHYHFFKAYEEPFYGICVEIDCQDAYDEAKENGTSFYLTYLHKSIQAVNETEAFRYRIEGEELFLYDRIDVAATVDRENGTFGFSNFAYDRDYTIFEAAALAEIERVRSRNDLVPGSGAHNVVYYSSLPWLKFTSLSHARHFPRKESIPKITFGKMTVSNGRKVMPVSIHVHHALVDGRHIGEYVERFEGLMKREGKT